MLVCNDRRWPEAWRCVGLAGAEFVLVGYNTPRHYPEHPETDRLADFHHLLSLQAGAYQNGLWVVAAAKAGTECGVEQIGSSAVVAVTAGLLATLVAGLLPAIRASRTPPLAALRDLAAEPEAVSRRRAVVGAGLAAAGVGSVVVAAVSSSGGGLAALGALLTLAGFVVLGPVVARGADVPPRARSQSRSCPLPVCRRMLAVVASWLSPFVSLCGIVREPRP